MEDYQAGTLVLWRGGKSSGVTPVLLSPRYVGLGSSYTVGIHRPQVPLTDVGLLLSPRRRAGVAASPPPRRTDVRSLPVTPQLPLFHELSRGVQRHGQRTSTASAAGMIAPRAVPPAPPVGMAPSPISLSDGMIRGPRPDAWSGRLKRTLHYKSVVPADQRQDYDPSTCSSVALLA